jgi:hypothetical protein
MDQNTTPSGCSVAADAQREVACAEDRDGTQRNGALANVGAGQWSSVGKGRIDAGTVPAALPQNVGEQAQLTGGRIEGVDRFAGPLDGRAGDEHLSCQTKVRHGGGHDSLGRRWSGNTAITERPAGQRWVTDIATATTLLANVV